MELLRRFAVTVLRARHHVNHPYDASLGICVAYPPEDSYGQFLADACALTLATAIHAAPAWLTDAPPAYPAIRWPLESPGAYASEGATRSPIHGRVANRQDAPLYGFRTSGYTRQPRPPE